MDKIDSLKLYSAILTKAKELGACLAGIAKVEDLKSAPSYTVAPVMPDYASVGANKERLDGLKHGEVKWPEDARSVIVVAVEHPEDKLEMDYWYGSKDPIGNRKLIAVVKGLLEWLEKDYGVSGFHLPYHVERGGIYLKDAAVYAGMGCIGKNNLLLTPEYGSRIRLRGLTLPLDLPSSGPNSFDPCAYCDAMCNKACPQNAFRTQVYTPEQHGRKELPGRIGDYDRTICSIQMKANEDIAVLEDVEGVAGIEQPVRVVKYCRICELNCPIGKGQLSRSRLDNIYSKYQSWPV